SPTWMMASLSNNNAPRTLSSVSVSCGGIRSFGILGLYSLLVSNLRAQHNQLSFDIILYTFRTRKLKLVLLHCLLSILCQKISERHHIRKSLGVMLVGSI